MVRSVLAAALFLVSSSVTAETLSVHVFKADDALVYLERRVPRGMEITVYSLDAMKKADAQINMRVAEEVLKPEYRGMTPKNAFTRAFSKIQNSHEWAEFNQLLQEASEPVEKAIRYRIKKLPAYVFDNQYIVYGVPSFREALAIYQGKVK